MLRTNADNVFDILSKEKTKSVKDLAQALNTTEKSILKISRYLEEEKIVQVRYDLTGPTLRFVYALYHNFSSVNKEEMIIILREFKKNNNFEEAKKLMNDLYEFCKEKKDSSLNAMYKEIYAVYHDNFSTIIEENRDESDRATIGYIRQIENYKVWYENIIMDVRVVKNELEPVPFYNIGLLYVQHITDLILERIKSTIISTLDFEKVFMSTTDHHELIKEEFKNKIFDELSDIFPDLNEGDLKMFVNYILVTSLGLGDVEFLLKDANLEEIVINNAYEPIWVYHRKYGWLKTNIILGNEKKIRHFATIGGRVVDKNITNLEPLLDGHLESGDRFNATLSPVSTKGNTITIRKFAEKPWTVVDLIRAGSLNREAAAMMWLVIQYEMSVLIVGGTGSGKTSALNVFSVFIPPNQRIISIEDTRELTLANTLHWVPMKTRPANPEGKGGVSMLDLIVNTLRMRPDRILFGEIRKKEEAETLFEAMHTGHSVIATFHANNSEEAQQRLTSRPIDLPKMMLSSLSFIMVLNRNRRTGQRVLLQMAEVTREGNFHVTKEFDYADNKLKDVTEPVHLYKNLDLYAGLSRKQVDEDIKEKSTILKRLVDINLNEMHELGLLISTYYTNRELFYKELEKKEKDYEAKQKKESDVPNKPIIQETKITNTAKLSSPKIVETPKKEQPKAVEPVAKKVEDPKQEIAKEAPKKLEAPTKKPEVKNIPKETRIKPKSTPKIEERPEPVTAPEGPKLTENNSNDANDLRKKLDALYKDLK
ncbi:Flp pilus assembly complex ATPase component TadA [Candidatus Woesearchaeota archaeon]|nr:Flp pilus assembly complex ATPase component TadA [Candidatus Woesearchaeota archaeon]